jgi:hypothetical protein
MFNDNSIKYLCKHNGIFFIKPTKQYVSLPRKMAQAAEIMTYSGGLRLGWSYWSVSRFSWAPAAIVGIEPQNKPQTPPSTPLPIAYRRVTSPVDASI